MVAVIVIVCAAVLSAALAGLYAAYYKVFYSPKKDMSETEGPAAVSKHLYHETVRNRTEELCKIPCEYIRTRSIDGLTLSARYYKGDDDKPLCICFHGYRGSAVRDFSGSGLYLIQQGYNVLLADERAHWRSEGHTIAFGIRERYDVQAWIQTANEQIGKDKPIYLFGISMGGGTVLMASGLNLPENVKGIVADCPFNSPKDIIKHVCRKIGLNPTLCWPAVWLSALIYGHFNINATTAAREAAKTKVPILIIHGDGDDFVPMYMSKEVKDANPGMIQMVTAANAGHGLSYFYEQDRYETVIKDFLNTAAK